MAGKGGWSERDLGSWHFIQISRVVTQAQALEASSANFPGTLAESWIVNGAAET